jgi:predicted nucleic acid-binding protein
MPNLTLSVDGDVIRKVRKVAIDQNTTLTQMVRDFLTAVAEREGSERLRAVQRLDETFAAYSRDMGPRRWTREDLHERHGIAYWDALIVAAAERGGCPRIYSEDLQHGRSYEGVRVENTAGA